MSRRQGLSKRTRFEIFKRDGFRCLYCGATPMQAVLRVDHRVPVAEGGTDDPSNLVTSCFDCNAGKGPVPLDRRKYAISVGADEQREHADQILEWLAVQRGIADARSQVGDALREEWIRRFGDREPQALRARMQRISAEFGVARVVEALDIVDMNCGKTDPTDRLKYLYGVLRRWREDARDAPGHLTDSVESSDAPATSASSVRPTGYIDTRTLPPRRFTKRERLHQTIIRAVNDAADLASETDAKHRDFAALVAFADATRVFSYERHLITPKFPVERGFVSNGFTLKKSTFEGWNGYEVRDHEDFNAFQHAYSSLHDFIADWPARYYPADPSPADALALIEKLNSEIDEWLWWYVEQTEEDQSEAGQD